MIVYLLIKCKRNVPFWDKFVYNHNVRAFIIQAPNK